LQNINDSFIWTDAADVALPPQLHTVLISVSAFVRISFTYVKQLSRGVIIVLLLLGCSAVRCCGTGVADLQSIRNCVLRLTHDLVLPVYISSDGMALVPYKRRGILDELIDADCRQLVKVVGEVFAS